MARTRAWLPFAFALLLPCSLASAQEVASPPATEPPPGDEPAATIEDVIVVTASRTEQKLVDAPATMTVFTAEDIQSIPADDYGDLLRNIPGMNVTQTSARDIQMTGRGSTNTLATTQLVLLDGRSIYLDFFGFVMWDFLPVNPGEIKQIEAVRGPGSAVWGANAMTGVVNLITKRPQEMFGTSLLLGGGELGTQYGSLSHAGGSERFGYKVSGGYYAMDAYERPSGNIPGTEIPYSSFAFENSGTEQAKGDVRLNWDFQNGSTLDVATGYAATDGIVHTGIGPFDVDNGSSLAYGKLDWNRSALHVGFFANFLDADSVNLLTRSGNGQPLGFAFATDTYNADISNTSVLGGDHHIVTYGANYRTNDFELEIAPQGTERDEWGVFLQDEILFGSKVRWVIGGRYDEVDPLESGVFTPRTSLIISPSGRHTWRVSYNEAFRTPSAINSYLDVTILQPVPIPGVGTFALPAHATGNVDLVEEHMTAYEVGYVGTYAEGLIFTLAAYRNETEDSIDFFTAPDLRLRQPAGAEPAVPRLPHSLLQLPQSVRTDARRLRSGLRRPGAFQLQLPQHRQDHRPRRRGVAAAAARRLELVRQRLVAGRAGVRGARRHQRAEPAAHLARQPRPRLRPGPVVPRRQRQLPGRGILGRRAVRPRHHRRLHHGQRFDRRAAVGGARDAAVDRRQHLRRGSAAARLRRHHQPQDHRADRDQLLSAHR